MKCPACGTKKLKVWRTTPQHNSIRRERICLACGNRIFTEERGIMALEFRKQSVEAIERMRGESAEKPSTEVENLTAYIRELELANATLKKQLYGGGTTREEWRRARRDLVEKY